MVLLLYHLLFLNSYHFISFLRASQYTVMLQCPEQFALVTVFQLFLDILVLSFTYFFVNI
jgi:hypothetical protein